MTNRDRVPPNYSFSECAGQVSVSIWSPWRRIAGRLRSARPVNAKGVASQSPGLPRSGYPGVTEVISPSTPTGLRLRNGHAGGTPLGFDGSGNRIPRVGAPPSRQPWAGGRNAFSVHGDECRASRPGANPVAPYELPPATPFHRAR